MVRPRARGHTANSSLQRMVEVVLRDRGEPKVQGLVEQGKASELIPEARRGWFQPGVTISIHTCVTICTPPPLPEMRLKRFTLPAERRRQPTKPVATQQRGLSRRACNHSQPVTSNRAKTREFDMVAGLTAVVVPVWKMLLQ